MSSHCLPTVAQYAVCVQWNGTHHSKGFILFYENSVRVIIMTANLLERDVLHKTQGVWWRDFPRCARGAAPRYLLACVCSPHRLRTCDAHSPVRVRQPFRTRLGGFGFWNCLNLFCWLLLTRDF